MIRGAAIAVVALFLAGSLPGGDVSTVAEVWIFTAVDCPIANGYAPEMTRLRDDYDAKQVKFVLVYSEPSVTAEEIRAHRSDYALTLPAVHDPLHRRVRKAGATTTPEVAVFNRDDQLVYRGRIDDRYTEFGDRRSQPTETYLRDVLDRLVSGEEIEFHSTEPIGCFIEALSEN